MVTIRNLLEVYHEERLLWDLLGVTPKRQNGFYEIAWAIKEALSWEYSIPTWQVSRLPQEYLLGSESTRYYYRLCLFVENGKAQP